MHSRRALPTQRSQIAFARGARTGVVMIRAGRGEDCIERAGVLGIPVSDQELQAVSPVAEVHERVSGLLDRPRGGRVGGDSGQVDAATVVLDDEQHVEPAQEDGV